MLNTLLRSICLCSNVMTFVLCSFPGAFLLLIRSTTLFYLFVFYSNQHVFFLLVPSYLILGRLGYCYSTKDYVLQQYPFFLCCYEVYFFFLFLLLKTVLCSILFLFSVSLDGDRRQEENRQALDVHKTHLSCLVARCAVVSRWAGDPSVQAAMVSCLPIELLPRVWLCVCWLFAVCFRVVLYVRSFCMCMRMCMWCIAFRWSFSRGCTRP